MDDGPTPLNAHLIERHDLNEALILFRATYDELEVPPYIPGQFVNLGLPPRAPELATGKSGLVKRPYSVSSIPGENSVEFFVRLVDEGALTPEIWKCRAGDPIWMDERFLGKFTLEQLPDEPGPGERDVVMISTGTGLAPFMSMLRAHREDPLWRRLVMINGVRIESDLGYREELEALERDADWFRYLPMLSRDKDNTAWTGLRGHVGSVIVPELYEKLVGAPLVPETCQVMLCGNPAMIDEIQQTLEARGFSRHTRKNPGQIHLERYW
jgi:ferredoxin--NADP+ reductase